MNGTPRCCGRCRVESRWQNGFEAHLESAAQQVDVVVQFLCGMVEFAIGQQDSAPAK